jgi:hypothetical protein
MKMMTLPRFTEEFGIPRPTIIDWIEKERGFAGKVAYKINSKWYIDIPGFTKWRSRKHRESYRYS